MTNINVDFHTHTNASKDCLTSPQSLIAAGRRKQLGRVVVADHNTIKGARAAHELNPDLIIVGEEIMTTCGEILAVYVSEEIPSGLSPMEAIKCLRNQGAFISVSHPFDVWRSGSWKWDELVEIVPYVDAIEVFNARCPTAQFNHRAQEFARNFGLPGTAGSDAHAVLEVGSGSVLLPDFTGADELRIVINEGKVCGRLSPFWVHFASRYATLRKRLGYN